jgi:hypothetical protein
MFAAVEIIGRKHGVVFSPLGGIAATYFGKPMPS